VCAPMNAGHSPESSIYAVSVRSPVRSTRRYHHDRLLKVLFVPSRLTFLSFSYALCFSAALWLAFWADSVAP
jgi:hypothetical protein